MLLLIFIKYFCIQKKMIDIKSPRLETDSQPGAHEEDPGVRARVRGQRVTIFFLIIT